MQAGTVGYNLTYLTPPKRQLDTCTVVGLTAAKFKPLCFLRMASPCPIARVLQFP
jgi:hypothetical protein